MFNIVRNINEISEKYIKNRLFDETGVSVENKEDMFNLQRQYCILLYKIDKSPYMDINSFQLSTHIILEVDLPNPDKHGIHHMTILEDIFKFSKREDGRWVLIS